MASKSAPMFWWMKKSKTDSNIADMEIKTPVHDDDISSSLAEFLEKEVNIEQGAGGDQGEVDIPSIIEEINRIAAQSPLGPFENGAGDRSIEDIMREAEKIYIESSRSFEQLSQHSATSHNISEQLNSDSTPIQSPIPDEEIKDITIDKEVSSEVSTPKSQSPVAVLKKPVGVSDSDEYSDDFSENKSEERIITNGVVQKNINSSVESFDTPNGASNSDSPHIEKEDEKSKSGKLEIDEQEDVEKTPVNVERRVEELKIHEADGTPGGVKDFHIDSAIHLTDRPQMSSEEMELKNKEVQAAKEEGLKKDNIIGHLIEENKLLKDDMKELQSQLHETISLLAQAKDALKAQTLKSPVINLELDKALEEVKDTKEQNTALQVQLDSVNNSHQLLKIAYEELQISNKNLERRIVDVDITLAKYKNELSTLQQQNHKSLENEVSLNKLLDIERLQVKSLKLQTDKDARCIMDLNRQIKEMERIIARKHPDSVSALIVAAKNDPSESNNSTKRFLEDRIKNLETEAQKREVQNSKVFLDVQEKFNQMKTKYESHIEDLELHVNDLKEQLKRRGDTFDVYTQTTNDDPPRKETVSTSVQTDALPVKIQKIGVTKRVEKVVDNKEETHLIATIRGLQTDLSNKEKVVMKLQREIDEVKKTNRRLQKEREGSLKNLSEKREFRSYPEKLAQQIRLEPGERCLEDELRAMKSERDKMKNQLCRMEEDYQSLKSKRIQDLNTLQEAHEKEISTYLANITPLREQLEIQQVSLSSLQKQLSVAKEELAIVSVERDHLNSRLQYASTIMPFDDVGDSGDVLALKKKVAFLEKRYEEREHRLRAIVHGLAQKTISNKSCDQCAARQQQLIGYKAELDQLIATLKCLQ